MIRGIFCHDLPIYKDINGNYCSTTLTDDLFARYLTVVDELVIATRVYPINKTFQEAHQERISLKNLCFLEFPNLNTAKGFFSLMPQARKRLEAEISKVDLIFIRGGIIAMLAATVARKLHKPYLLECAGCAWDTYWNYSLVGKLIAPYAEYRAIKDVREASHVIYVTERWLQNRYPTKGEYTHASNVILLPLDDNTLIQRLKKVAISDKKKIVIGTTAGIGNKAKGQQYLIEAMSRLPEFNIIYELVGGGDKTYLQSVAQKYGVEDRVIFKGQLNHEQVLSWLDSIDLYIQPSMQEGLPRALIEAMSRACPSVGSTTAGIPELLEPDATFERGNEKSLIKVLKTMIASDWSQRAEWNFKKAKEYEIDKLNARRNAIYQSYKNLVLNGK